jgi:hypothetical protein
LYLTKTDRVERDIDCLAVFNEITEVLLDSAFVQGVHFCGRRLAASSLNLSGDLLHRGEPVTREVNIRAFMGKCSCDSATDRAPAP